MARVVALVGADDGVPGRGDWAMAKVFLSDAGFEATVAEADPTDAGQCAEVAATAGVVLTGSGVEPSLRACLIEKGVTLVSHDPGGDRPPTGTDGGQVVSSRRGVADSLVDLGLWGASSGVLDGKVGLVVANHLRPGVEVAAAELRRQGVELIAVRYVEPGPAGHAAVSDGVREFAADGVEVVVFALPVEQQRTWLAQAAVFHPGARYVVSDAAGPLTDEVYPANFAGALAHTSFRVPWFSREHGETPQQVACRTKWEASAGFSLGIDELARAFAWCQHVALVQAATDSAGPASLPERLRTVTMPSPLTSDLGPLPDGGYGPTQDAVLLWNAGCTCWVERRGFEPRQQG